MTDRYAVIGHPVSHSLSPEINTAFARASGQQMSYERLPAPLGGFERTLAQFRAEGGKGANVTLPFKEEAFRLTHVLSDRARSAGAVNTLHWQEERLLGDNTDGAGLVADLQGNLKVKLSGRRILLVGAGGAARGVLQPLLQQQPQALVIANRTPARAQALVDACPSSVL